MDPPEFHGPGTLEMPQPQIVLTQPKRSLTIETNLGKDRNAMWEDLTSFYRKNEETIRKLEAVDLEAAGKNDKGVNLQWALDSFVETTKVILDGLVVLGNVHPILGVAIFAFHSIISIEITRRENDKKVLAVKLQMQKMMCAMFQLKDLKHAHIHETGREEQERFLQELVKEIAADITRCGSDLNSYMNRKTVSRFVHAKGYEFKFAEHIANFTERRSQLMFALAAYTAASADHTNLLVQRVDQKVDLIGEKVNLLLANLFPKLVSAREAEVYDLVKRYGGFEEFLKKDDLLTELYAKAIDPDDRGVSVARQRENLQSFKKELRAAVSQDLNDILSSNLERFEKLLTVQNNNNTERLSNLMQQQGNTLNTILNTVTSLSVLDNNGNLVNKAIPLRKEKLQDPEFQQIWDQMRLGRSVKAKTFVLTFRDHFLVGDKSMPGTPHPTDLYPATAPAFQPMTPRLISRSSEAWVFDYIDVTHVQPIIEAMDEDGSGFISVREANKFASSRPKGVSLLNWIAYWAGGWHINTTHYYHRIYTMLVEMHATFKTTLWANQPYADGYLNSWGLLMVEGILRSIKPLPPSSEKEPMLSELEETMRQSQEALIETNLKEVSYILDSPADVAIVAGTGRVETWFLPLTCLLLERHLSILRLANDVFLNEKEMDIHSWSLRNIVMIFTERMHVLKDRFEQIHGDVERQFTIHAYGMFYTVYKETAIMSFPSKLLDYQKTIARPAKVLKDPYERLPLDTSILTKGIGDRPRYQDMEPTDKKPPTVQQSPPHPIHGDWIGVCSVVRTSDNACVYTPGSFEFSITVEDLEVSGIGTDTYGEMQVEGSLGDGTTKDGPTSTVWLQLKSKHGNLSCLGTYDHERDVIKGDWYTMSVLEEVLEGGDSEGSTDGEASKEGASINGSVEKSPDEHQSETSEDSEEEGSEIGDIIDNCLASEKSDVEGPEKEVNEDNKSPEEVKDDAADTLSSSDMSIFQSQKSEKWTLANTFIFTRTPKDVYRFRYLIDYPASEKRGSLARRRWFFAIEAVVFRLRRERGMANAIKTGLAERTKWIELSIRYRLFRYYSSTRNNLSHELADQLMGFLWRVPPENAVVYQGLTNYYYGRFTYNRGIYCYSCCVPIPFTRFVCITCVDEEDGDQIVLCPECIQSLSLKISTFTHSLSHCLICCPVRMHCYELLDIFTQSRRRAKRLIASFKEAEARAKSKQSKKHRGDGNAEFEHKLNVGPETEIDNIVTTSSAPLKCACCDKNLTLPFWACVKCELDTLFCLKCEPLLQHLQPRYKNQENHSYKHPRLLITYDNKVSADSQNIRLERQLSHMDERILDIHRGLTGLDESFGARLDFIQASVKDIAAQEVRKLANAPSASLKQIGDNDHEANSPSNLATSPTSIEQVGNTELRLSAMEKTLQKIEENMHSRIDRLEAKVDSQLGQLLAMMQEVVAGTKASKSSANI
ncbi:hypothetical protein CPC08DRAFT_376954 [Agrocybe pediades]|nr:hypothetical protein CPC08DRAFT_376954 [Agrocybe pediades]